MKNPRSALLIVLIGLMAGVLGNILFYNKPLGVSFPLFITILIAAVLVPISYDIPWRNLWPLIPAAFFAMMVAVLDNPFLTTCNVLATLALGSLVLSYLPGFYWLDKDTYLAYFRRAAIESPLGTLVAPFETLETAWTAVENNNMKRIARSVIVGLVFAIPVLIIFGMLLGSADAVFAEQLDALWRIFQLDNIGSLMFQIVFILVLAWLVIGAVSYGIMEDRSRYKFATIPLTTDKDEFSFDDDDEDILDVLRGTDDHTFLGSIESSIILGSVALLFFAFIVVQFTYFFGGGDTLTVTGIGHAQYARRGFFELLTVAVLVLAMALVMNRYVTRKTRGQEWLFRGLLTSIIAMTGVMLVSAWQRMTLYEQAFGYTHLRLYTHFFMLWLGILLGIYLVELYRVREHAFSLGLLVIMIGYLFTLNVVNPDRMIAQRNIDRFYAGYDLDVTYFRNLSADAVPPLVTFYEDTFGQSDTNQVVNECIGHVLYLMADSKDPLPSLNLSRLTRNRQLEPHMDRIQWMDDFYSVCAQNAQYQSR